MSRVMSNAMIVATESEVLSPILLVSLGFGSGAENAWSGYGNFIWNGITFIGVGTLGSVEPSTDTSDLSSNGCIFHLSGIPSSMISLVLSGSQQGLPAKLWIGCMDTSGNLIPDPVLVFSGLTDVPTITESGDTCDIALAAENKLARIGTALMRRFTADDQAIDYPGDRGFDYVPSLQDSVVTFG